MNISDEGILDVLSDGQPKTLMEISSHFTGSTFNVAGCLMGLELNRKIKQLPCDKGLGYVLGRTFVKVKG